MSLIPPDAARRKIPCRFIPLNERGETIDSFYRSGTAEELESAFGGWLKSTIETMESKNKCRQCASYSSTVIDRKNSTNG